MKNGNFSNRVTFLPSEDSPSIISCFDMSSPIRSKDPIRESTAPVSCLNVRDPRMENNFFSMKRDMI